jgi:hypothetical protein
MIPEESDDLLPKKKKEERMPRMPMDLCNVYLCINRKYIYCTGARKQ